MIESGSIELTWKSPVGTSHTEIRSSGSVLGELSILRNSARTVNATAKQPTCLLQFDRSELRFEASKIDAFTQDCYQKAIGFAATLSGIDLPEPAFQPILLANAAMTREYLEKSKLAADLRSAIETHSLYFELQAIHRVSNCEPVGFEALCRWSHPELGPIAPGTFIPLAKDTGQLCNLTRLLFPKFLGILHDAQCSSALGRRFFGSFNITLDDLSDDQFAEWVINAITAQSLNPSSIKLELTEDQFCLDNTTARETLAKLHAYGVKIAIDDFGTGYSNLAYIKEIPFSTLKLDREFVNKVHFDKFSAEIVKSVANMGKSLGYDVVAEGVEIAEVFKQLRSMSVELVQGYYFSKPMNADMLIKTLV